MAKRLKGQSGYSLVEVMVAIIIMTLAILPMVTMFDMGLHSTTEGSKYDKARMLANLKLEQAKNLPFDSADDAIQDVEHNFPEEAGTVTDYDGSGFYQYQSGEGEEPGFPNFAYLIEKQYMVQPCAPDDPDALDQPCNAALDWTPDTSGTPTNLIRVTVTVQWDDNEYKTYGLVTG
jgi:prepilin-type N-terminal cleavage/methylation domain-containing protein